MGQAEEGEGLRMEMSEIRGAVARGWCHPKNSAKVMDTDLAEAISEEVYKLLEVQSLTTSNPDGR
jgi:hypothetical protein